MHRFRIFLRNHFGFSSGEVNGLLILLPLMAVFIFSEPAYRWWFIRHGHPVMNNQHEVDSIMAQLTWTPLAETALPDTAALFLFDPNTAPSEALIRLGISKKVAEKIIRYRSKGGQFRIKTDFAKIYGLDSGLYRRLAPYISLAPKKPVAIRSAPARLRPFVKRKTPGEPFDINLADSSRLIAVYGIGPRLATRIIKYRERLGGFVSMVQLSEIYGLDSVVVGQLAKAAFVSPEFQPRRINLNTAGKKELTSLPYIKFTLANAITTWRFQHGDFKNPEELRQIVLLDEVTFEKIKPYLTVKE